VLGARIPAAWSLEFTISLTFIALGVSVIKDRAMVAAALASACVAALAHPLPYRSGLILAALAGIAAGVTWERWSR
jgi:predicted branched-subunit amino acid permease